MSEKSIRVRPPNLMDHIRTLSRVYRAERMPKGAYRLEMIKAFADMSEKELSLVAGVMAGWENVI